MGNELLRQFEEIGVVDKMEYLKNRFPEKAEEFNEKVTCLHCDKEFVFNEFKVVKDKFDGNEYIVCKHFPDCNGSIIDFM
jgi:hypothetical protein